jgi:transposase
VLWHVGRHRRKVSVIAALCVDPGRRVARLYFQLLVEKNFDGAAVLAFSRQLSRHLHAPMALVWDRSNTHRTADLRAFFARIGSCTFHFPAYAPELNPVEYVWSYLKTKPLANLACPNVEEFAVVGRRHARSIQRQPHLLRSFIRHSPLPLRLA